MNTCLEQTDLEHCDPSLLPEWLETNGLGGYACSTTSLCNARRYHGLLVAAVRPPSVRRVLLAKLDLTLIDGQDAFELSTNQYPDVIHPHGDRHIESFHRDPWPTWTYRTDRALLRQELFMVQEHNLTVIRMNLLESHGPVELLARPKVTSRDHHALGTRESLSPVSIVSHEGTVRITWADGRAALFLTHDGEFEPLEEWYWNLKYAHETKRGFDDMEDLLCPGIVKWTLQPGEEATVVASTGPTSLARVPGWMQQEIQFRASSLPDGLTTDPDAGRLGEATRHFLVRRSAGSWTVIAGYPWFGDWGRDAFISLPGLTLVTGRYEVARNVLRTYAEHLSEGMLPNRFPDTGEAPDYNSVDASLWYLCALSKYLAYTGDSDFGHSVFPVVREILSAYENGARYAIRVDDDGLLSAGQSGVQLTWMDAKIGDWVVTPRVGKPVEIQGLWSVGLMAGQALARECGALDLADHYEELRSRLQRSFEPTFWNERESCCHDVIAPDGTPDSSLRPNQLLAIWLAPELLSLEKRRKLIEVVREYLLTPMGLRTLAPNDPRYAGLYDGDWRTRDAAYHQGTVWPWLLGPYISASLRNHAASATRESARERIAPLVAHLGLAGLGHVSEIADGDSPHIPRGCFAQAWSVAEPLRALCEDVICLEPESPGSRTIQIS